MNLIPDAQSPGLWVNQDWKVGTPGAFALIIGVSEYEFLDGTPQTNNLGQLYVSSLTAYSFFRWLRDSYRCTGVPLAKCWLLLSPCAEETAFDPLLGKHTIPPTFDNCKKAVAAWWAEMNGLPQISAEKSRSFFFFSGHGLEIVEDKQILLPRDYLSPPVRNENEALSTRNLSLGLKSLKVPHHFFFIDACRNDYVSSEASIDGARVLSEKRNSYNNPDCCVPLFYATAAGTQAWQPTKPSEGLTVFGQALLEGLEAKAGLEPDCSKNPCIINLSLLNQFVNPRINEIIQSYQSTTISQKARLRGDATLERVTELVKGPAQPVFPEPPPPTLPSLTEQISSTLDIETPFPDRQLMNLSEGHEVFGSEQMSALWLDGIRVYDLKCGQWLDKEHAYAIHEVKRDASTRSFRIELSIPKRSGNCWLEISDSEKSFGCILPGDESNPRYVIELEFPYASNSPRVLRRVDVSLSPKNFSLHAMAVRVWEKYNTTSALEAATAKEMDELEKMVCEKFASPLAATIAGSILLRARRWDKLHDWLRNLANWFTWLPDGPILWSEQLLRSSKTDDVPSEIVKYLLLSQERGLPFTIDAFGFALSQLEFILESPKEITEQRSKLQEFQARLRQASKYFHTGGMFCVFAGPKEKIKPALISKEISEEVATETKEAKYLRATM